MIKVIKATFTTGFILMASIAHSLADTASIKIAPPPLVTPYFQQDATQGRVELVNMTVGGYTGYGVQGIVRHALTDQIAITGHVGFNNLSGSDTYTDNTVGEVKHKIESYTFVPYGLTLELQQALHKNINLIVFAGPRFHTGNSRDEVTTAGTTESIRSADSGVGYEYGLQMAIKTGALFITPFASWDSMEVDTTSKGDTFGTEKQQFSFNNHTLGFDLSHDKLPWTLSALLAKLDSNKVDDVVIVKIGRTF